MIRVLEIPPGAGGRPEWRTAAQPPATEPGVYTTTRTAGGRAVLFAPHLARLADNARARSLVPPPAAKTIGGWLAAAPRGAGEEFRVRLEVLADGRFRVIVSPLAVPGAIRLWPAPPGSARADASVKDCGRDALDALEREARANGADEALLRMPDGALTETTRSCLLFVEPSGRVVVPEGPALPGVTLAWALARLRERGREIAATRVRLEELDRFAEWLALSATKGPVVVVSLAGWLPGREGREVGPVLKYLRGEWSRLLATVAAPENP